MRIQTFICTRYTNYNFPFCWLFLLWYSMSFVKAFEFQASKPINFSSLTDRQLNTKTSNYSSNGIEEKTLLAPHTESPPISAVQYNDQEVKAYDNFSAEKGNNINNSEEVSSSSLPSEIQKAVCTVTAGDVKASAEAVTTKTLKGVCGSSELHLALQDLESRISKELSDIKFLLQQYFLLADKSALQIEPTKQDNSKIVLDNIKNAIEDNKQQKLSAAYLLNFVDYKKTDPINNNTERKQNITPLLKSLPTTFKRQQSSHLRESNITISNHSILNEKEFKVFTYYWKLDNVSDYIHIGKSIVLKSPVFSIKGKMFQLKAIFNNLHRDYLYLQLENTPQKSSSQNNIELDMGNLFKEISTSRTILYKHKIAIWDQYNSQRNNDLVSKEFYKLQNGFSIPNSALLSSPYIKNNSLLIQLSLYL